jgi:hypothetical protein
MVGGGDGGVWHFNVKRCMTIDESKIGRTRKSWVFLRSHQIKEHSVSAVSLSVVVEQDSFRALAAVVFEGFLHILYINRSR